MSDAALAAIETPDGEVMLGGGKGVFRRIVAGRRLSGKAGPINDTLMRQTFEAAEAFRPDAVIYHPKLFGAPHIAEKYGIPAFLAALQPMVVPTCAFPAMGLPALPSSFYNRFTYALVAKSLGMFRGRVNRFRKEALNLLPVRRGGEVLFPRGAGTIAVLHAYSPLVLPRPDDWPLSAVVTGYWRLRTPADYKPPAELTAFLRRGPAPVFIGFGSMTSADPEGAGKMLTAALRRTGQRGVIARGWAQLEVDGGDDIIAIPPVPFDWLFPQMAAVVHHGGAGTTAAGFLAGVPSVFCPFFGDQPGWARLGAALGVATAPLLRKNLTEERLAAAINEAVANRQLKENAMQLAAHLGHEDGVGTAVSYISDHLEAGGGRR